MDRIAQSPGDVFNFEPIDLVSIPSIDLSGYRNREIYREKLSKMLDGVSRTEPYYNSVLISSKIKDNRVKEWMVYNKKNEDEWEFSGVVVIDGKFKPVHNLTSTLRRNSSRRSPRLSTVPEVKED